MPDSVLWLLRFPPFGEPRIHAAAAAAGIDPARIIFTDVAAKPLHIRRRCGGVGAAWVLVAVALSRLGLGLAAHPDPASAQALALCAARPTFCLPFPSPAPPRSGAADLFLDTPLCNAHTTGCDVLWGGCPLVTLPLERFASRVAASLAHATGLGAEMVVGSQQEYEDRVRLGWAGLR